MLAGWTLFESEKKPLSVRSGAENKQRKYPSRIEKLEIYASNRAQANKISPGALIIA